MLLVALLSSACQVVMVGHLRNNKGKGRYGNTFPLCPSFYAFLIAHVCTAGVRKMPRAKEELPGACAHTNCLVTSHCSLLLT